MSEGKARRDECGESGVTGGRDDGGVGVPILVEPSLQFGEPFVLFPAHKGAPNHFDARGRGAGRERG